MGPRGLTGIIIIINGARPCTARSHPLPRLETVCGTAGQIFRYRTRFAREKGRERERERERAQARVTGPTVGERVTRWGGGGREGARELLFRCLVSFATSGARRATRVPSPTPRQAARGKPGMKRKLNALLIATYFRAKSPSSSSSSPSTFSSSRLVVVDSRPTATRDAIDR